MTDAKPKAKLRDDPSVREVYVNKCVGTFFDGGAVTLTFGNLRLVPENADERPKPGSVPEVYVTHRISMSPSAALEVVNNLNTILTALTKAQGNTPAGQAN